MPSPIKDMLKAILATGTLTAKDREVFEGMWDQCHRGKLSHKQYAWVQDVYYKQHLDRMDREPPKRASKVLVLKGQVTKVLKARSAENAMKLLPGLNPESPLGKKIAEHFASGGEVLEVRPA